MQKNILTAIMVFWSMLASAQNSPQFAEVSFDKATYQVGQKVLMSVLVRTKPTNPNYEVYARASFDSAPWAIVKLTDDLYQALGPAMTEVKNYPLQVKIYIRPKSESKMWGEARAYYSGLMQQAQDDLEVATDPEVIAELQAAIASFTQQIGNIDGILESLLTEVETQDFQIPVTAKKLEKFEDVAINISSDHSDNHYITDERATFFVHILTTFEGHESVVRSKFEAVDIGTLKASDSEFTAISRAFTSVDSGEKTYEASLYIREKARADALRGGIEGAQKRIEKLVIDRDTTNDPEWRAYLDGQIAQLELFIAQIYQDLEDSLIFIETSPLAVVINEA